MLYGILSCYSEALVEVFSWTTILNQRWYVWDFAKTCKKILAIFDAHLVPVDKMNQCFLSTAKKFLSTDKTTLKVFFEKCWFFNRNNFWRISKNKTITKWKEELDENLWPFLGHFQQIQSYQMGIFLTASVVASVG